MDWLWVLFILIIIIIYSLIKVIAETNNPYKEMFSLFLVCVLSVALTLIFPSLINLPVVCLIIFLPIILAGPFFISIIFIIKKSIKWSKANKEFHKRISELGRRMDNSNNENKNF